MAFLQGFGPEGDYLRGRFATGWKSTRSYTDAQMGLTSDASDRRVAWGNKNFTPPEGADWVRFGVRHSGADPASVGSDPMHRHDGTVVVELFVREDTGEGTADDWADDVCDIYRDLRTQQGLRFSTPYVVDVGPQEGGWYKKDVLVPFVRDTVFT